MKIEGAVTAMISEYPFKYSGHVNQTKHQDLVAYNPSSETLKLNKLLFVIVQARTYCTSGVWLHR